MSWWNNKWTYREKLNSTPSGSAYTSGVHFLHVEVNLQALVTMGFLRSDYRDARIIYASGAVEHNVPYYIASGVSPAKIYFPAQNDIPANTDIGDHGYGWEYYLYYGNANGDAEQVQDTYVNRNFPQAPYSATTEWYQPAGATSGYRDKCLYRLNDDPAVGSVSGFQDATSFTEGWAHYLAGTSGVYKGKSGRLDLATEFDRSNRGVLKVEDGFDGTTVGSGNWCIDFWVYPYDTAGTQYWFLKWANNGQDAIASRYIYNATYDKLTEYTTQRRDWQFIYNTFNVGPTTGIEANQWHHIRLYYAKKYYTAWSCVVMYLDGALKGSSVGCYWPPDDEYVTQMESGVCAIGGAYGGINYELDGKLEQFRYSTHPWFAQLNYDETNGDSRYAPPDWVDTEYTLSRSDMEVNGTEQSGLIGGILRSATSNEVSGIVGGFLYGSYLQQQAEFGGFLSSTFAFQQSGVVGGFAYAEAPTQYTECGGYMLVYAPYEYYAMGGFVNALPLQSGPSGIVGGALWSAAGQQQAEVGGFTIGTWSIDGNSSVDGLLRTLVKGHDSDVHRQKFGTDAQFTIYAPSNDDFDAELTVSKDDFHSFDAQLEVQKTRKNTYVEIIDVDIQGSYPWTVTVTASGKAYDVNNEVIPSGIHSAVFVWTDGDIDRLSDVTASGSIFSYTHVYSQSGIYQPIVMGYDKTNNVGSDRTTLNFASGIAHPYISLSGSPRAAIVPPILTVDFTYQSSGILGATTVFWDYGNGIAQYNNAKTSTTQYAMPGDYIPYVRLVDQRNVPVVDTLRIGFNR
jgi:hypothetical protein